MAKAVLTHWTYCVVPTAPLLSEGATPTPYAPAGPTNPKPTPRRFCPELVPIRGPIDCCSAPSGEDPGVCAFGCPKGFSFLGFEGSSTTGKTWLRGPDTSCFTGWITSTPFPPAFVGACWALSRRTTIRQRSDSEKRTTTFLCKVRVPLGEDCLRSQGERRQHSH